MHGLARGFGESYFCCMSTYMTLSPAPGQEPRSGSGGTMCSVKGKGVAHGTPPTHKDGHSHLRHPNSASVRDH